jgi:choline-sulfatase
MLTMAGDLSLNIPTYPRALQKAGYYTAGIGKFHFLQGWTWNSNYNSGHNLVELENDIKKYGFDYIWESDGKQLAVNNYSHYCKYLDDKGLLNSFRDDVTSRNPAFPHALCNEFKDSASPSKMDEEDYIDIKIGDMTIDQIENCDKDKPFFIFSSFCGPHEPFDPPKRFLDMFEYEEIDDFIPKPDGMEAKVANLLFEQTDYFKSQIYKYRRAYKAMIACIDEQIGRIFNALERKNLLDDTVIIFTADHGKMFGDRGYTHKSQPYKYSVTVPTAIRHPDYLTQKVNPHPMELTDITATILDIAGLNPKMALRQYLDGLKWLSVCPGYDPFISANTLLPIIKGETEKVREYAFSECSNVWQMIQTDNFKYIKFLNIPNEDILYEELYDTTLDPDELNNLAQNEEYAEILAFHRRRRDFVIDNTPPLQTSWSKIMSASS